MKKISDMIEMGNNYRKLSQTMAKNIKEDQHLIT